VEYRLAPLSFHVSDNKINCVTGGIGGTAASLLKTGSGILELTAPLAVTGGVSLAGGILRLSSEISPYSPAPGLIESRFEVPDKETGEKLKNEWYTEGSTMNTNRVVMMPEMAEQHYEQDGFTWIRTGCEFVRYKGYIWNRADHDVTWTFAVAICPQSILYIGTDENKPDSPTIKRETSGNNGWKNMGLATVTLSPGPHYFDLRMYSQGYDKPGARGDEFGNWPLNYGFAIDFEGRGTMNAENFSIPSNNVCGSISGGDGALFTLDKRTRDDVTGDDYTRASFPFLDAVAGTTFDLNAPGYTFTVQELCGITAAVNGNLHVASKWTLSNEALDSKIPLSGDGKLSFGPNWTLSIPDLNTLGLPNRRTIAVAEEGGLTLPAVFDRGDDPDFAWRLELSADGRKLQLVRSRFVISIR
jgi:autotransporter-associated beta strand protein